MRQEITNPRRVVVLVESDDGDQDGWDVFDVDRCRWEWAGMDDRGTRATVTVSGAFHRIRRSPERDAQFQAAMDRAAAELAEPPQIGGPDGS